MRLRVLHDRTQYTLDELLELQCPEELKDTMDSLVMYVNSDRPCTLPTPQFTNDCDSEAASLLDLTSDSRDLGFFKRFLHLRADNKLAHECARGVHILELRLNVISILLIHGPC